MKYVPDVMLEYICLKKTRAQASALFTVNLCCLGNLLHLGQVLIRHISLCVYVCVCVSAYKNSIKQWS